MDRVTFIVSFVAENSLQSVRRPADDYISQWYYEVCILFHAHVRYTLLLNYANHLKAFPSTSCQ